MRWLLIFAAGLCWGQTQVSYQTQVKLGPVYVSPALSGLPTVCATATPLWIVGNVLYQNQSTPPACNWQALGVIFSGTPNAILKFVTATQAGNSGLTDDGTTIRSAEALTLTGKVNFSGATQTLPFAVYPNIPALPTTGCLPGQLGIVLSAGLGQQIYENSGTGSCSWTQQTGVGSVTIPVTTNMLKGDGSGNGADSGIVPANVVQTTGSYSNPGWITALAATKITGILPVANGGTGTATPSIVAGTNITVTGSWPNQTVNSTGGGSGTIPNTTNILNGDGAGNAADSGVASTNVVLISGSYSNPAWITALSASILGSGTVACGRLPALTGDTTTSAGSCATVTSKINGTSFPASTNVIASNSSNQPVAATGHNVSVPHSCTDSSGSPSAQSCNTSPSFTLAAKDVIYYTPGTTNTGDLTVAVNGGSAIHVRKWLGASILASGDLPAGVTVPLAYDGTFLEAVTIGNPPAGSATVGSLLLKANGSGGFTNATAHDVAVPLVCPGGVSDTGTAMTCTTSPSFSAATGDAIIFTPHTNTSGSSVTLNVNGSTSGALITKQGGFGLVKSGELQPLMQAFLVFDGINWQIQSPVFSSIVTSVAQTVPSWLAVAGSPVTTTGTLAITPASAQTSHQVIGTCGSATTFTPCALVAGDLPAITSGSAIQKGNGSGALTAAAAADVVSLFSTCSGTQYLGADGACHNAGGSGTVTSVAQTVPSWLTVGGSPVTTSGTLAITATTGQSSHQVIGTCGSGTSFAPCSLVNGDLPSAPRARSIGASFGVKGGTALTTGQVVYVSPPFACTISAWTLMIDAGTITIDVWKIASGTAVPTVANTITASALPAIASGTALHSTTLTSWTTSVAANDFFGFDIQAVSTATTATIQLQCDTN